MSSLVRIPDGIKVEVEKLKESIQKGEIAEASEVMRFTAMADGPIFYQYLLEQGIYAITKNTEKKKHSETCKSCGYEWQMLDGSKDPRCPKCKARVK